MRIKRYILFLVMLFMLAAIMPGCGGTFLGNMFINRKAIAEQALKNQYGEELVAYHTWDEGGDSFDVSLYPKTMRA